MFTGVYFWHKFCLGINGMQVVLCGRFQVRPELRRNAGFTLIELIVVVIILSILAATALPRFANLQTYARIAKLNAALGALKGGSALAHAACLVSIPQCTGQPGSGTVNMEGVSITMVNTYPTADAAGIVRAAGLNVDPASLDGYLVQGGGPSSGSELKIMVSGNDPNNCFVTYKAPPINEAPLFGSPSNPGTATGSYTGC
jgi:MSHA pilin protein MshA